MIDVIDPDILTILETGIVLVFQILATQIHISLNFMVAKNNVESFFFFTATTIVWIRGLKETLVSHHHLWLLTEPFFLLLSFVVVIVAAVLLLFILLVVYFHGLIRCLTAGDRQQVFFNSIVAGASIFSGLDQSLPSWAISSTGERFQLLGRRWITEQKMLSDRQFWWAI